MPTFGRTPFDKARLAEVFGGNVTYDAEKAAATLTHAFGGERFLEGHFPGFPIVPGVILLDGMILVALHAFERATGRDSAEVRSVAVESAVFYRPVLPGPDACFGARHDAARDAENGFAARCSVMVAGARHVRANLMLLTHDDETHAFTFSTEKQP